ncbi:MAG: RHS domain-containing protein, partial [Candidatus Thiodiazotropha endolucinida]|nr:RHS domain-containing protein [Candidatus Thiodiazotropha taylori]MCG8097004.1 RHS domain-containing protein [Candidatus Thiodiazotropha endolucinida]MCG8060993.1 RHS domain-containing protein [Candidatus Thiodiazotropha taylori]MCG8101450.1 RHS domain-containing protein [Candidatus Thiodiazotropha taylori]MCG8118963.1 RHS domain-containing protein [Candidatus Thiodiazotropha taylori]
VALVTAIQGPGCSSCGRGDVSYRYNEQLQLTEITTQDGITKQYQYDEIGRTAEVTRQATGEAPQTLARYEYADNTALKPSAVIRPSINPQGEHRLDNRYNRQGQPTQLTERGYRPEADGSFSPIERTTRLDYNAAGNLIAIDGPREDVEDRLQLSYDNQQRLKQLKTPDGRTLSVTRYDAYGRPQQVHGSGQAPLTLSYNSRGKVTQVGQGQQTVRYDYDATGHLTGITDPDGKQITLNYDQAGRATGLEDSNGNRLEQALDTEGRLTQRRLKDAQGQLLATVSYLYDAQGRLSARQTPRGQTHYRYDDAGNLTEVQDPQGHATALDYNGLGQLLAVTQPGNRVTQLHYDENGKAIGLTDPRENTTDLIKDDFGNLIRQRHPDTGEVRYAYDRAGNHIQKIDAQGVITSYRFDAANRLIEETTPSGTTSLDYDPNTGRLAQLTDDTSHEGFAYDDQGRLIQHSRHIDGHRYITGYAYNAQGKLSQKTLPDGQVLSYHYYREGNQKGQLRAITRKSLMGLKADMLVGEIDQDQSDGATGLTFGNGLRETRYHDKLGRTTAINHSKLLKLSYHYDAQGRITGIDYNGLLQNYDYDLFGRLSQAETQLGSYRYDYDSLGNRTQKQHTDPAGNTTTQENRYPDPGEGNRLLSQQNGELESYQYNPAGSPEQIGERYFEYDDQQRPVKLYRVDPEHPDNKTLVAAYAYNRFGERIKKVVYTNSKRPKVTYYLYDSHQLTAEADESGKVTAQYHYQQQRPILKLEGKTAYAIHTDHLGAPRAVTDEDQQTIWSADYSPFGLIRIEQQAITLNLRLPGQYEDQETNTYYNYHRDYDPNTGRYLTSDPIGLKGGLNTYAYALSNPVQYFDPYGLDVFMFDRDLDGVFVGRHKYLVLVPDNPNDFSGRSYNIGNFSMTLQDLGNGTYGFVIGAQNDNDRLIVQPFNSADYEATQEFYNPGQYTSFWRPDFSATSSLCSPNTNVPPRSDTQIIEDIIAAVQNYARKEASLNIRYPSATQQLQESDGYVNSNSWAHTIIDFVGLNVVRGDNWSGVDALSGNRLDHGYFSAGTINQLDAHNVDTDGDGDLDNIDNDDDGDGTVDTIDADRRDGSVQ